MKNRPWFSLRYPLNKAVAFVRDAGYRLWFSGLCLPLGKNGSIIIGRVKREPVDGTDGMHPWMADLWERGTHPAPHAPRPTVVHREKSQAGRGESPANPPESAVSCTSAALRAVGQEP